MRKPRKKVHPVIPWTREQIENKPNLVVPALLTSSYIYYCRSDLRPIMADEDFDWACNFLRKQWRTVEHPHKHLINRSQLRAGTFFDMREAHYPSITKNCAVGLSVGDLFAKAEEAKKRLQPKPRKRRIPRERKRTGGFLNN